MSLLSVSRRSGVLLGERRTTIFQRFSAKGIDFLVITALYVIARTFWMPLGAIAASVFAALQDSFGDGQSIGKKIIGLRVIDDQTGMGCPPWNSFLRNAPYVLAIFLSLVPVFWVFGLFIAVACLILESYLVCQIDSGIRLGDVMGSTLVVEHFDEELGATSENNLV